MCRIGGWKKRRKKVCIGKKFKGEKRKIESKRGKTHMVAGEGGGMRRDEDVRYQNELSIKVKQ